MTKKELLAVHPTYTDFIDEWKFYINSYLGGKFYRDGDYLLKHPFESLTNYTRRKDIAYYYNYCAPIIDLFTSYLTKDQPVRSYGSLSSNKVEPPRKPTTLFDSFWWDVDFEGTNFEQFMRDAQRYASIYGMISIIVDKPALKVETQAQALAEDIRPYLTIITPENMLDWRYVKLPNGKMALDMVKINEGDGQYRIWTRTGWESWSITAKDKAPVSTGKGEHGLGKIPIVDLYNKKSLKRRVGISEIQDIADINKNIYYFCSDAKEIIENTAFPMLAMATDASGGDAETAVGTSNIIDFDPDQLNGKPFWLEPPHSSLAEIREWIQQDGQEMVRIAKMGGLRNTETSVQPWSGVSIEAQERQLYSSLAEKASNAEQAELDIFNLYAAWEDTTFEGNVKYSRSFATRDLTTSLTNAITAGTAKINSLTYEKERQKKIVDASTAGIEESTRTEIFKEIDELDKLWFRKEALKTEVLPLVNPDEKVVEINNGGVGVQNV